MAAAEGSFPKGLGGTGLGKMAAATEGEVAGADLEAPAELAASDAAAAAAPAAAAAGVEQDQLPAQPGLS